MPIPYNDERIWSDSELETLKDETEYAIIYQSDYLRELSQKRFDLMVELERRRNPDKLWFNKYMSIQYHCARFKQNSALNWYYVKEVNNDNDELNLVVVTIVTDDELKMYRSADLFTYTYKTEKSFQESNLFRYLRDNYISYAKYADMVKMFKEQFL